MISNLALERNVCVCEGVGGCYDLGITTGVGDALQVGMEGGWGCNLWEGIRLNVAEWGGSAIVRACESQTVWVRACGNLNKVNDGGSS